LFIHKYREEDAHKHRRAIALEAQKLQWKTDPSTHENKIRQATLATSKKGKKIPKMLRCISGKNITEESKISDESKLFPTSSYYSSSFAFIQNSILCFETEQLSSEQIAFIRTVPTPKISTNYRVWAVVAGDSHFGKLVNKL
jgi:hypothetical protein